MRQMVSVSVQSAVAGGAGAGRAAAVRHLHPGESVLFAACGCGGCRYDLVVPVPAGVAIGVGRITAGTDHWRLDNPGPAPLVVEDLEQPPDLITAPAGRAGVVVPFELARVGTGQQPLVTVFGPEPADGAAPVRPCRSATGLAGPGRRLDPQAIYFAVLVTLCEPRLRQSADASLPTSAEIAQRLARRGITVSPRAVDWHIEYLADKLGLRPAGLEPRPRRGWRKEAVAAAALRRLLVRPEHVPRLARPHDPGGTVRV